MTAENRRVTTLRDINKQRVSITESVALLVRAGWEPDYVLELPIDSFTEVLLVAQKQQIQWQMQMGMTIMSAAAALFSKDGSQQAQEAMQGAVDNLDTLLQGGELDVESDDEWEEVPAATTRRRRKKSAKKDDKKGERMVRRFHAQFSTFMSRFGIGVPDLDSAMKARANLLKSQTDAINAQTKKS